MGRKSKYAEHFEISSEKATFKKCGEVVKMPGRSTTGLQLHLSSRHSIKPNASNDTSEAGPAPKKCMILKHNCQT